MSLGWGSLPHLPLKSVLDHLSTEDALTATTVCRHWRTAILLYEGHKETLKLRAKNLEKNMFVARVFRKHVKRLHVHLDCDEQQLDQFLSYVLPQFFDSLQLQEIIFIGPSYLQLNPKLPVVKLKRIITESLVFKHLHSLQRIAILGCEIDAAKNDHDRYAHKQVEYYSRHLSFSNEFSLADSILSNCNVGCMMFSTLQHIALDYDQINTESLETLSHLPMFAHLTLNIGNKQDVNLAPIDWNRLQAYFPNGLEVSVNIISLPYGKFDEVIENVLVEGLNLTSLKVMFCKTVYAPLITHIVRVHKSTLRELVWADAPYDSEDSRHRIIRPCQQGYDTCNVNPFILLCWQCLELRRLVIHGYWIWQYDILGFIRLRNKLQLEISAVHLNQGRFTRLGLLLPTEENIVRVFAYDNPMIVDQDFVQQVNEYTETPWSPQPWTKLHPALRAWSPNEHRLDYILKETFRSYGAGPCST